MDAVPEVVSFGSADALAINVADRLLARLGTLQREGRTPSIVLTGGSIAVAIYREVARAHRGLRRSPTAPVDWSRVDFWFGDERFVPSDHPDRNAGQAARAMLDFLPVDPDRVHIMAPSDGEYGEDVDAAAAAYAEELHGAIGPFDVLMLGIGPDGHCASLFPGRHEMYDDRPVVAVRNSPKPPPTRITLTMGPLRGARELWWVAAGNDKAQAVRDAMTGADPVDVPAAGPKGLERTLWMLDEAAASLVPPDTDLLRR